MDYKKAFFIFFIAFASVFVFSGAFKVNAKEFTSSVLPIEKAKSMAIDSARSIIFILNFDGTISAYNLLENRFVFTRKKLSGIEKSSSTLVSKDGSKLAVFYGDRLGGNVSIFNLNDILTADKYLSVANYSFPKLTSGVFFGEFSENSKDLYVAYGENNFFILSAEKNFKSPVAIVGIPIRIDFDKLGNLFVLNAKSETVSKIDVKKKAVMATIKTGANPKDLLFNSFTNQVYVSHIGSDDVYVLNAMTGSLVKKVQLGGDPTSMAYDKTSGNVFVASNSSGILNVISPDFKVETLKLDSTAYFESAPFRLFYEGLEKNLFILNSSYAELLIYNTISKKIVGKIKTDYFPVSIFGSEKLDSIFLHHSNADSIYAVNSKTYNVKHIPEQIPKEKTFFLKPQGIMGDESTNRIFVTNLGSDKVQVIDGSSLKIVATITVGRSPQSVHIQPVTKKLYAYSPSGDSIAVVDITKSDYPTKSVTVGKQPFGIASNSKTNKLYVSFAGESQIGVMDGASDQLISRISLPEGSFPLVISVNEKLNKIYSAAYGRDFITVIDGGSDKIKKQINVGQNPIWVTYIPELDRVFVTVEGAKKIIVIDPNKDEVAQEIKISAAPYRIFFDKRTNYIYINHRKEPIVTVLSKDAGSSDFRVVIEERIPFWGETDAAPYNMVWWNKKTNFAYLTSGDRNTIDVIKDELDDKKIRKPVWYATINADGSTILSDAARENLKIVSKYNMKKVYYGAGAIVVVAVAAWFAWFLRKRKEISSV